MTAESLLVVFLYTVVLMTIAAWSAGFSLWPLLGYLRSRGFSDSSSGFWLLLGAIPLLVGLVVGGGSLGAAVLKGLSVISDHCQAHPGHPHLCLAHAQHALPRGSVFWGGLAGGVGLFVYSLLRVGGSLLGINRTLRKADVTRNESGFWILQSRLPTAFVAGIVRPRLYLTTRAAEILAPRELEIVAAHEQEHLRRRDPLKLAFLRVSAQLFPGFRWVEEQWRAAVEIECDWACIEKGAELTDVSSTILKLARSSGAETPALAYATGSEAVLRRRVERLLSGVPPSRPGAGLGILAFAVWVMGTALLSGVHHVLETILGRLVS